MSDSDITEKRNAVRTARDEWRTIRREITRTRIVYDELQAALQRVERGVATDPAAILEAVDRFGRPMAGEGADRRTELSYLTAAVVERDDRTVTALQAAREGVTLDEQGATVLDRLEAYVNDEDVAWAGANGSVRAAFAAALDDEGVSTANYSLRLEALVGLFKAANEAARALRDSREAELNAALESYTASVDAVPSDLDGQPIALLPVQLETRFVRPGVGDDAGVADASGGEPTELWVRVYPDQIHIDAHEEELTDGEAIWGRNFWTAVWYASHPELPEQDDDEYYEERLPEARLRTVIDGIDPEGYSDDPENRYAEIKERAWGQVVDRFGRERAAYVVHATAPENPPDYDADGRFSDWLLRPPPEGASGDVLPPLRFPDVDRRPESWTKQPRARLLPDRWIAVAYWKTAAGAERRATFVGDHIHEPLPAGPNPEAIAGSENGDSANVEGTAPEGMNWMVEFERAEAVGMGLRIPGESGKLADLDGFDPGRGFSKLLVLGVRSSVSPDEGSETFCDLLDAHHYTDGLSIVPQGTPTNVHDAESGYSTTVDPAESVEIECGPPLVGEHTDGGLLARALAIDPDDPDAAHVFAHVANADATNQRDARYVNTVLWPATLGYYAQHMLMPSTEEDGFGGSLRGGESRRLPAATRLQWFDAFRRHFIRYVRARGPFPAIRAGSQPYGILPVAPIVAETDRAAEAERDRTPIIDDSAVDRLRPLREELERLGVSFEPGTPLSEVVHPDIPIERYLDVGFEPTDLYYAGVSAAALYEADVSLETLEAMGASPDDVVGVASAADLLAAGYEPPELLEAGYEVADLADAGIPAADLVRAGVAASALLDVYPTEAVLSAGVATDALLAAGVDVETLVDHGAPLADLHDAGISATALHAMGRTAGELRTAGYTVRELRAAGFSAAALLNAGVDEETLATAGYRAEAISEAGASAEPLSTRYDPETLRLAGYTAAELRRTGFDPDALVDAGYPATDLLAAGFTAETLHSAGVSVTALWNAGVSAATLYEADIPVEDLREIGVSARELKEAGLSARTLHDAGFSAEELRDAGFAAPALKEAGVTVGALKRIGFDANALRTAGVSAAELRDAGFSARTVSAADFDRETLEEAGYSAREVAIVPEATDTTVPADTYGVTFGAPSTFAERTIYGFGFDPARSRIDDRGSESMDRPGRDRFRWFDGGASRITQWRASSLDHRIPSPLARFIHGGHRYWNAAVNDLEWVDTNETHARYDETILSKLFSRRAVSASLRLQGWFGSPPTVGARRGRTRVEVEQAHREQTAMVANALSYAGLSDLDPRLGHLLLDGTIDTEVFRGYLVDDDIGTFLRMLANEPFETIQRLGYRLEPDDVLDISELDIAVDAVENVDWQLLSSEEREHIVREAFVENLPAEWRSHFDEDGGFAFGGDYLQPGSDASRSFSVSYDLLRAAFDREASASIEKFVVGVALETEYDGDPALLKSVLRLLCQFGTLHEYLAGRQRLGLLYGDETDVEPEPTAYGPTDPSQFSPLFDEVPAALREDEDIPDAVADSDTYADLLFKAAVTDPETTALYPRISEYADGLQYLAGLKPATLRSLLLETLDLASHRLDAWWTSLATKRLFELREIQIRDLEEVETGGGTGPAGGLFRSFTRDDDLPEEVGDRPDLDDLLVGIGATDSDAGLYVGAYGFVEDLRPDPGGPDAEYIHAPSQQHAATAAVLRSAHQAHDPRRSSRERDGGDTRSIGEAVAVNLSAERVREAKRLIDGVRRGQSLAELLGYRFERRLYEASDGETNLKQYQDVFRRLYPAQKAGVEAEGETSTPTDLDAVDVVDGRALANAWPLSDETIASFSPARKALAQELPDRDDPADREAWDRIDGIVNELQSALDAVSDLLLAESVHQLCQGNFEAAGASLDTLAKGEIPPELTVTRTPRSAVGVTHRTFVLLDDPATVDAPAAWSPDSAVTVPSVPSDGTGPDVDDGPVTERVVLETRAAAEPALNAWLSGLFPDPDRVRCAATYHWETTENDDAPVHHEHALTVTLADFDLSPLDALFTTGTRQGQAESELEQRLAYHLLRNRPANDPSIPPDADLEVTFEATAPQGESAPDDAVSFADFLELTRSLRELVTDCRPADADDLSHPTSESNAGYPEEAVALSTDDDDATRRSLRARADAAQDGLEAVTRQLADRLGVLAPESQPERGIDVEGDGDSSDIAGDTDASESEAMGSAIEEPPGITDQVTMLVEAVDDLAEAVPFGALEDTVREVTASEFLDDIDRLSAALSPGPTTADEAIEAVLVSAEPDQDIAGEPVISSLEAPPPAEDLVDSSPSSPEPPTSQPVSLRELWRGDEDSEEDPDATPPSLRELWSRAVDREWVTDEADPSLREFRLATETPRTRTVTVHVWSRSPTQWFTRSATVETGADGVFTATFDFDDVEPGTPFEVVALENDRVLYAGLGRVLAPDTDDSDDMDPATVVEESKAIQHLLRLARYREPLRIDETSEGTGESIDDTDDIGGAAQRFMTAHTTLDWNALRRERAIADESRDDGTTITGNDIDAIDTLFAIEEFDAAELSTRLDAVLDPPDRLGLIENVDLVGDESADRMQAFIASRAAPGIRTRIERALANPARLQSDDPPALLPFDPDFVAVLGRLEEPDIDPVDVAADIRVLLNHPAWLVSVLGDALEQPHTFFRQLAAFAYHCDEFRAETSASAFADRLEMVANAFDLIDDPGGLFLTEQEGVVDGRAEVTVADVSDPVGHLQRSLRTLADVLRDGMPSSGEALPDRATQRQEFETDYTDALSSLEDAFDEVATRLDAVQSANPPPIEAVRRAVLESLRAVLVRASYYGVFGSTPESPVGAADGDEAILVAQARAVAARIAERLDTAQPLRPTEEEPDARPITEQVEDQRTRLEALFDDSFVVLPPFQPTNGEELQRTFTDESLLDDAEPLAGETWLWRAAQVRDRPAALREGLSYAETIGGTLRPTVRVGQLPHRAGEDDTWVGIDDDPDPGRLSLVAQFDAGGDAGTLGDGTPVTGLFVDEWVEDVPSESETTGLAVNYDDPGAQPPQSILVATPPIDGRWSLEDLEKAITETMSFMKYRAVDLGDLRSQDGVDHLLPALTFPKNSNDKPDTPSIDFDMLRLYNVLPLKPIFPWFAEEAFAVSGIRFEEGGGDSG